MTETEVALEQGAEQKLDPHFRDVLRRRLGRLADYAAEVARTLNDGQSLQTVADRLAYARDELADIVTGLTSSGGPDIESENTPHEIKAKTSSRLAADVYPDHPFYNGVLPGDQIPELEPWDEAHAINVYVIDDHYVYCPETEMVCELKGDPLFLFNALLVTQKVPRPISTHRSYGFRESATEGATKVRFRTTVKALRGLLSTLVPKGFGDPVVEEGNGPYINRMLHPDIVVTDARGDEGYAHLIPQPVEQKPPEVPALNKPQPGEGLNLTQIAATAGVSRFKATEFIRARLGDAYDPDGNEKVFPLDFALAVIAEINGEGDELAANMLPGYGRLSVILKAAKLQGATFTTSEALSALRTVGFVPQRLNVERTHTTRGGVWCVQEEGAVEALLRAKGIEPPEPTPPAETDDDPDTTDPPAEEAEPANLELKGSGNTFSSIVAFLNATEDGGKPYTVEELGSAFVDVLGLVDPKSVDSGQFSHYAARKIVAAAKARRG